MIAGVDLSTQSCTVELRAAATMMLVDRASYPLPITSPPCSEHDANDWWFALQQCFAAFREAGVDLDNVEAISVGGQCHGLVPLDEQGHVIRKVKLWNDTTSAPNAKGLVDQFGREFWIRTVGSVPSSSFTISKLASLLETEPELMRKVRKILLPHDYLTWRLSGRFATDRSEASGTGYFSSFTNQYLYSLLRECFGDALPWEELFPRVLAPSERVGSISAEASRQLGLPQRTIVAAGGGDQHLAAVGLGMNPTDLAFSLGTSGVVMTDSSAPILVGDSEVDCVASATGGWLPLACTLNCTKVTDRMSYWLGVSVEELDALALNADPAVPRPVFVPWLDGERTPTLPTATGTLTKLTGTTSREQMALSAFEGVVLGLVYCLEAIDSVGIDTSGRVLVVGGGAKSPAYRQVLADLLGREILRVDAPEATARGACIQALAALRGAPILTTRDEFSPPMLDSTVPRRTRLWDGLAEAYQACSRIKRTYA